jgi:hypothetical protein
VVCKGLGCYLWEGASADVTGCKFTGGLHGLYIWGRGNVTVSECTIADTERACICVRDGAVVTVEARTLIRLCGRFAVLLHTVLGLPGCYAVSTA